MKQKARGSSNGWLIQKFKVVAFSMALFGSAGLVLPQPETQAFPVQISNAPQSDFALTASVIKSATRSILLNVYEFTEPEIASLLEERIRAGVHVEILQEGQPVGGIKPAGRDIQSQLLQAMSQADAGDQYYEMKQSAPKARRRFRFDHAKYMVVDGQSLLIGSENYSPTGHPIPGNKGNRGWEVFIHEENLARSFAELFAQDTNPAYGDIEAATGAPSSSENSCDGWGIFCPGPGSTWFPPFPGTSSGYRKPRQQPVQDYFPSDGNFLTVEASLGEGITSPDSSLPGLLRMIQNARVSLDLEQMDFKMDWKEAGGRSPLFDAIIQAAQRGVHVRVLLNDEMAFVNPPDGGGNFFTLDGSSAPQRTNQNQRTVDALNQIAQAQGLPIQAKIADLRAMGVAIIHNKGALVDGTQTLISSINWNENSVTHNREAAVLLTSPDANRYFGSLFEQDWQANSRY